MEAIILAGGFGTRLQHIVKDVPKPMAPINNKPFLEYIIKNITNNGVEKIVLAVGYKKNSIINYFGDKYKNIVIKYSVEDTPLLTGGAIKKALKLTEERQIFVINGDTYFDVNLFAMLKMHERRNSEITIAAKKMDNFDRYGNIITKCDKIINFEEKKYCKSGFINGGIYCINRACLDKIYLKSFSFEKDFLEKYYVKGNFYVYKSDGYFIDIGIPNDYFKAQKDFINGDINE